MTYDDDNNEKYSVIDGVDDSVVADSQPVAGPSAEWTRCGRSRILGEHCDRTLNTGLNLSVDLS